ncbi:MAG: alginate export family protein [Saprospiraceae bacterium]|nr:alginate export family protein [Saprospiraceae bacterium]
MKPWFAILVFFTTSSGLIAQYRFQSLRFNEDYSYLKNDSTENWHKKMKFTKLNTNATRYLSQGGEVRYQFQHFTNEDWGAVPVESYNSFYTRFLYHTDIHFSKHFRLFNQFNSTFAAGRVTPDRPIDENQLAIQQIFFDVNPLTGLTFRFGRQELLYGSQRLIAVREGPNNRQSYDAAKVFWKKKNFQIDAYYSHPVRVKTGIFDDQFNEREKLWSTYTVWNSVPKIHNMDLYYIGYYNQSKRFNSGIGEELRHSIGTRIWRNSKTWNYDFEALYQFGSWGNQFINAYTASIDLNYTFYKEKTTPTIGVKTEIISGDKSKDDNQLNSFNPLFPRGAYFGLAALIGPVNLVDFHPNFSFKPFKNFELSADYDVFWRYSVNDGIYGPNVVLIFDDQSESRFIGHQAGVALEYQPNAFIKLTPEAMWFYPGQYLKDVSPGEQVFFAAFTAQFKF